MTLTSGIFNILTIVAGGVSIMLFVSTKTLRDSRDDLRQRRDDLEEERTRDKATITSQAAELLVWQHAVTGEAQLTAIIELLKRHDRDMRANWVVLNAALNHVGTAIDRLIERLEDSE
jgi:hypothetical protein